MEVPLSKEQWDAWKQDPVTNLVFQSFARTREEIKEQIARGNIQNDSLHRAIGACQVLVDVLEVNFGGVAEEDE